MKKISILISTILGISLAAYSQTGKVGIGTTAPTEKLHVAGNIKADTVKPNALKLTVNAGSGKILTSDAAGNASWQTGNVSAGGNVGYGVWGDCATNGNISEYQPITNTQVMSGLGSSVSINGNFAIVGAPSDEVGGDEDHGSVSFFQYGGTGWVANQRFTDSEGEDYDRLGFSVSISGNLAVAGAPYDNVGPNMDQGSVSFYQYNGTSWEFLQKITDPNGVQGGKMGYSVAIDGDNAVVGSIGDIFIGQHVTGSASVYHFNGSTWDFVQKFYDSSEINSQLGSSVSISGNRVIVGAPDNQVGFTSDQGSANINQYNRNTWELMARIYYDQGIEGDEFGSSVSISGNDAIIGAPGSDLDAGVSNRGVAFYFRYNGRGWINSGYILDPEWADNDRFGRSVYLSGNYAMFGLHLDNIGKGSAILFQKVGYQFYKLQKIIDPSGYPAQFGYSIGLDTNSKRFIIGAPGIFEGKVVFGKIN